MSARFTLYGQSLLRNANGVSYLDQERHWERDWIHPPRSNIPPDTMNNSPPNIGTPLESSSNTPQPSTYNFQIKTWVIKPNSDLVEDGNDADLLQLSEFKYMKNPINDHEVKQNEESPGGLTEADIRGAVGGVERVGFGSSSAKPE